MTRYYVDRDGRFWRSTNAKDCVRRIEPTSGFVISLKRAKETYGLMELS